MLLHVGEGVLVRSQQSELHRRNRDQITHVQLDGLVPFSRLWVSFPFLVCEFSFHEAAVSSLHFVDADGVRAEVVGDDEFPVRVLWVRGVRNLRFEPQDHRGLGHLLAQVLLWWLRPGHAQAAAQTVLLGSDADVRWDWHWHGVVVRLRNLDLRLLLVVPCFVEFPCEGIAVVDKEIPAEDGHLASDFQVGREVILRSRLQHAGADLVQRVLLQRTLFEEHRIGIPSTVPYVVVRDLDAVVGEEKRERVVRSGSVHGVVVPVAVEPEHSQVVLQKLLKLVVRTAITTNKLLVVDFSVDDFLVGRLFVVVLLGLLSGGKVVQRHVLFHARVDAVLLVVPSRERITGHDPVHPRVNLQIRSALQVVKAERPRVVFLHDAVSFEECAAHDAAVLDFALGELHGAVLQKVNDGDVPNPRVLIIALRHRLLRVREETADLLVVLDPCGPV
mmetsp:Transcript_16707/g.41352  ORF Transcript_16707/g.41352 Transcript_16707/m.41352 type:complete len:445 (-) Transcript_16707:546-1880(-)